jgi:hypothetical protein
MQPLTLAVQNAVPPQDMGVATSSATFFRQMGGTLGTAVFLSCCSPPWVTGSRGVPHRRGDAGLPGCAQGPEGAGGPDQPAGGG